MRTLFAGDAHVCISPLDQPDDPHPRVITRVGWGIAVSRAELDRLAASRDLQILRREAAKDVWGIERPGLYAAGLVEVARDISLPYFYASDDEVSARGIPTRIGAVQALGISHVTVAGDPSRLEEWLEGVEISYCCIPSAFSAVQEVIIDTTDGPVSVRGESSNRK
jgi:hypothetical protein